MWSTGIGSWPACELALECRVLPESLADLWKHLPGGASRLELSVCLSSGERAYSDLIELLELCLKKTRQASGNEPCRTRETDWDLTRSEFELMDDWWLT